MPGDEVIKLLMTFSEPSISSFDKPPKRKHKGEGRESMRGGGQPKSGRGGSIH
jgi:hypothetical protein